MSILDRLYWLLRRRHELDKWGGHADRFSYASPDSTFAGNNVLGKGARIIASALGRHTYVARATIISTQIGAFCSVGPNVTIGGLGSHPISWISTHPIFYSTRKQSGTTFAKSTGFDELKTNTIGNDVWIGANVLVLDGIEIGDGAVVAAGAVVTKDVAPYAVVGGVPAKLIKQRFSDEVIQALLAWRWWDLPDAKLRELAEEFVGRDQWQLDDILRLRQMATVP